LYNTIAIYSGIWKRKRAEVEAKTKRGRREMGIKSPCGSVKRRRRWGEGGWEILSVCQEEGTNTTKKKNA